MWYGLIMSEEEIWQRYGQVRNKYSKDKRKTIPREEFENELANQFDIPLEIAKAYVTLSCTYYSTDWYTVLDNVTCLMRTKMVHDVYEMLGAIGEEKTIENAKKAIKKESILMMQDCEGEN